MMDRYKVAVGLGVVAAGLALGTAISHDSTRVVHGQTATVNGVAGQNIVMPAQGVVGAIPFYDLNGNVIAGQKCAQGNAQTDSTGAFTFNFTGVGFKSAITYANVNVAAPGAAGGTITALTNMYSVSYTTPSLTNLSGRVAMPATVVVGGLAIAFAATPVTVYATICGQ